MCIGRERERGREGGEEGSEREREGRRKGGRREEGKEVKKRGGRNEVRERVGGGGSIVVRENSLHQLTLCNSSTDVWDNAQPLVIRHSALHW